MNQSYLDLARIQKEAKEERESFKAIAMKLIVKSGFSFTVGDSTLRDYDRNLHIEVIDPKYLNLKVDGLSVSQVEDIMKIISNGDSEVLFDDNDMGMIPL